VPRPALRIFFHNRCYDGATSAAIFAEFFRRTRGDAGAIEYRGMAHSLGDPFADAAWDAEVNACVDFRYCADIRMHWWFDHHESAFQPSNLREHFDANPQETKFYDPRARSCSVFMTRALSEQFQFALDDENGHWKELLHWADKIDGAVFNSAQEIVERREPALKLMTWLRNAESREEMARTIEQLGRRSQEEMIALPWIAASLPTLLDAHRHSVALIKERLVTTGPVSVYDLADDEVGPLCGFAAYMHNPSTTYSIGLTRSGQGVGISVGFNPWARSKNAHNIASICEQYGGGGHPMVGGISLPGNQLERARDVVEEIATRLSSS